jgi:hypothetical protein
MNTTKLLPFETIARKAVLRLIVAQWIAWLGRTAAIVFLAATVTAVAAWLCKIDFPRAATALGLLAAWVAVAGLLAWLRRPTPTAAMARWDAQTGRQEMFTSAFYFESLPPLALEDGERLHLLRARRVLAEAAARLPRDIALPWTHRCWLFPLFLLVITGLLPGRPLPAGESTVDEQTREAARQVSSTLAQRTKLPETAKGLTVDEAKDLKKLKQAIAETTEHLASLDKASQRDVLGELEQRARDAEKLADALHGKEDWPSSKMIEELERHADTTEFAAGLRAKDLDKSAGEAKKLGDRLEYKDLSLEEGKRIDNAFDKSLAVADKDDKEGLVGKHLAEADKKLKANEPKPAGKKMKDLADTLAQQEQRQNAQKQLQQVADQLREAGQSIFGQQSAGIRRLAQNQDAPDGLRQVSAQDLQSGNESLTAQLAAAPSSPAAAQLGLPQAADPNAPLSMSPVPGDPADMGGMSPVPGSSGMPGDGQSPVPGAGQDPGDGIAQGSGSGDGNGDGFAPVPGAPSSTAGTGGNSWGRGTAGLGDAATQAHAATTTRVVNAAPRGNGPSQYRNVEAGRHREETRREASKLAADFIKAEEQALADEPLPVSRRQQVLRYFTAIRSQLVERQPPTPDAHRNGR